MTVIIFLIVLSIIVFVHELGHFVMAKRAGMKVEEFGFGFPPRLWGHKPKNSETTYTINAIPFGGFVKVAGEDESESKKAGTFGAATLGQKVSMIVAGVVMNFLFALVLFVIINMMGAEEKIVIREVDEQSPAAVSGMKAYDELLGFETLADAQDYIKDHRGQEIVLQVKRRGEVLNLAMTPRENPPPEQGAAGIHFAELPKIESYPWHQAIWQGVKESLGGAWLMIEGFAVLLKHIFITGKAGVEVTGPVGIAIFAGEAARLGFVYLLQFMAIISLNLAIINIIPFPALDGGRLLFVLIEKIKGSPIPKKIEGTFNTAGFMLLLLLMFYITTKDVIKFF